MDNIIIGKILKPHGIKGEVKVLPITHDVRRFNGIKSVFLEETEYNVANSKIRDDGVYLTLEGIDDRNEAEKLRNMYISVPRDKALKPDDGWFIVDLIGCTVSDDKGYELGRLTEILQNGCADVYCIDKGKIMFPALKKLLKTVDIESKTIIVDSHVLKEVAVYEN